jgi:hypothetical protein
MRKDPYERLVSELVRDLHEEELRDQVDAALARQLAAFLAMQRPAPPLAA